MSKPPGLIRLVHSSFQLRFPEALLTSQYSMQFKFTAIFLAALALTLGANGSPKPDEDTTGVATADGIAMSESYVGSEPSVQKP